MNQTSKLNYAQLASPSGEVPERAERGFNYAQPTSPSGEVGRGASGGLERGRVCLGIAIASFIAAVAFSIAGFIVPPVGDLTDANLYLIAQFLLVTTSLFGVSSIVNSKIKPSRPRS